MLKRALVLTTTMAILACGTIAASAQAPGSPGPASQQSPTTQEHDMMGPGMMGHGMFGGAMTGHGYGHHDWDRGRGSSMAPTMMRIIFSLMDADGDGKLTLQEFQAAHERIFKAMDADHDGTVTFEEMQAFIRGISNGSPNSCGCREQASPTKCAKNIGGVCLASD